MEQEGQDLMSDLTDISMNVDNDRSSDHSLCMILNRDANEGSDDNDDDGGGGKPAAAAETTTPLKQIKSIWEDDKVHVDKSNKQWTCLWCNCSFALSW